MPLLIENWNIAYVMCGTGEKIKTGYVFMRVMSEAEWTKKGVYLYIHTKDASIKSEEKTLQNNMEPDLL